MKRRSLVRLNALSIAKMLRYLQEVPANVDELAEVSGLTTHTVRKFVLAMHREGAIRTSGWEPDTLGRYVTRVYSFGEGRDAPKPKKERGQVNREYRARREQMRLQNAIAGVAA
jgi:predicted ArsR family transcriptional regulator